MPDNITGIMTSKAVFYAMELAAMERYASFKDYISEMSVNLSSSEIKRIAAEIQQSRKPETVRDCFFVDEDGAAHIFITGPLENAPDPCAIMFNIEMTTAHSQTARDCLKYPGWAQRPLNKRVDFCVSSVATTHWIIPQFIRKPIHL